MTDGGLLLLAIGLLAFLYFLGCFATWIVVLAGTSTIALGSLVFWLLSAICLGAAVGAFKIMEWAVAL